MAPTLRKGAVCSRVDQLLPKKILLRGLYGRSDNHVRCGEGMTGADFAATRNFPSCMGTRLSLKPMGENLDLPFTEQVKRKGDCLGVKAHSEIETHRGLIESPNLLI